LIKYPSSQERNSSKLIPEPQEVEELSEQEELKKIAPVSLPKTDPFPVKAGHHFLHETSFEDTTFETGEELIGYGYQCPKLLWQLEHFRKPNKLTKGKSKSLIFRTNAVKRSRRRGDECHAQKVQRRRNQKNQKHEYAEFQTNGFP
jgi:hypothetical protein